MPRDTPSSGGDSGSSHTDRNARSSRSAAPSGPAAITGADHLARVDLQLEGGQEQVVLGAEVVVHQRRVDPGVRGDRADRRTGEALAAKARGPRRGSRPGCRVRPAADRPAGGEAGAERSRGLRTAKCGGRTPATPRRSASRSSRVPALRVLISSTMWPSKPRSARWPRRAAAPRPAPGTRCSSLADRCRRSGGCAAAGRRGAAPSRPGPTAAIAAWERSMVVLA